MSYINSS